MNKIKNIEKVSYRIKQAIKDNKRIVLFGDADLDGTSSVIILKEAIEEIGGNIFSVYFPDRNKEGHGLSDRALNNIIRSSGKDILLIVMDCGISNIKEAKRAKELGVELIIIDHHQPHEELPEASIIVNPKQKEDNYPFKEFANAGIVFYLAIEIMGETPIRKSLAELAALATISDMMKQEDDNKLIIDEGLDMIEQTNRPGLKVFWEEGFLKETQDREAIQKIISFFNASEIVKNKTEAYIILTLKNKKKIRKIAKKLIDKNLKKQEEISRIVDKVSKKISLDEEIIFKGSSRWNASFLGSIASRIENKFKKPTFIYSRRIRKSRGAVRMPSGMNAVNAMEKSSKILLAYGGHPPAAGFSIKNKNLKKFKKNLIKYFKEI
jgi:single-stranded-DNA-specific exonuclease